MENDNSIYCVVTGKEIDPAGGWYNSTINPISEDGVELLIEQYVQRWKHKGAVPYWLYLLNAKFLKRKVRVSIPKTTRQFVLNKYKFTCAQCGSKDKPEIDHIKPVSRGGTDELYNLQVLCKTCNVKKSNKL